MPNWCYTTYYIEGDREEIFRFGEMLYELEKLYDKKMKEREEAEREAAKAHREEGPELSPARARLAAQLRERHLAEKDVTALLGLMQEDAQATALANTVMHWNPDRFRTEKGQKEFRASVFEEAMRIWQEDEED